MCEIICEKCGKSIENEHSLYECFECEAIICGKCALYCEKLGENYCDEDCRNCIICIYKYDCDEYR